MTSPRQLMLVATCAIFVAPPAFAQDDSEAAVPAGFGGTDAVANKMADDNLSLNEWRQNLKEDYDFSVQYRLHERGTKCERDVLR